MQTYILHLVYHTEFIHESLILISQGSGVLQSSIVQGMVFKRAVEGEITKAKNCKVAVYSCPLDAMQTETKVCTIFSLSQSWPLTF